MRRLAQKKGVSLSQREEIRANSKLIAADLQNAHQEVPFRGPVMPPAVERSSPQAKNKIQKTLAGGSGSVDRKQALENLKTCGTCHEAASWHPGWKRPLALELEPDPLPLRCPRRFSSM